MFLTKTKYEGPHVISYLLMSHPGSSTRYVLEQKGVSLGGKEKRKEYGRWPSPSLRRPLTSSSPSWGLQHDPSVGQGVNPSLDVLEQTEKDHVVDRGPDQNDGDALVHAGLGDSHTCLVDLLALSEQHALRSGLAGVEGVGLNLTISDSSLLRGI